MEYAKQNKRDYDTLLDAVRSGEIKAISENNL
jgi:hypothetical protein